MRGQEAVFSPEAKIRIDLSRLISLRVVSSVEEQTPMQVTDALEIGSITKSFTVVVALQLQEEGIILISELS